MRPVWAGARFELRIEMFNVFNRVNYGPPAGNVSAASFGTITTTYDGRQVQIGTRVMW